MSFFNKSDGSKIESSDTFSVGGNIEPIPDNTDVLAAPEEAKWDDHEGDRYISIKWNILASPEYKGRKIYQKLWVLGNNPKNNDPKKQGDKAKEMLLAIDRNAGGKIADAGVEPTNESLSRFLLNKQMVLKLMVWEIVGSDGKPASGNWVCAVSPKAPIATKPTTPEVPADAFDEDIPY